MGSQQDVFDSPGTAQRASALFWSRFPSTALGAGLHRTLGGSSCCPPVGTIIYLFIFSSLFFVLGGCFPQESLLRPRHTAAGKYPRKASRDPWGNTASILAGSGPECAWTAGGGNWVTELAQLYCSAFLLFPPLMHAEITHSVHDCGQAGTRFHTKGVTSPVFPQPLTKLARSGSWAQKGSNAVEGRKACVASRLHPTYGC